MAHAVLNVILALRFLKNLKNYKSNGKKWRMPFLTLYWHQDSEKTLNMKNLSTEKKIIWRLPFLTLH